MNIKIGSLVVWKRYGKTFSEDKWEEGRVTAIARNDKDSLMYKVRVALLSSYWTNPGTEFYVVDNLPVTK